MRKIQVIIITQVGEKMSHKIQYLHTLLHL